MRCEAVHDLLHGCMSGRRSSWCLLQHRGAGALPGGLRIMCKVCACAGVAHVRQTRQTRAAHGRCKRLSKLRRFGVAALPAAFRCVRAHAATRQPIRVFLPAIISRMPFAHSHLARPRCEKLESGVLHLSPCSQTARRYPGPSRRPLLPCFESVVVSQLVIWSLTLRRAVLNGAGKGGELKVTEGHLPLPQCHYFVPAATAEHLVSVSVLLVLYREQATSSTCTVVRIVLMLV